MNSVVKKHAVTIISVTTIIAICIIWLINGAELEDTWLYAIGIIIVTIPTLEMYFKKKDKR